MSRKSVEWAVEAVMIPPNMHVRPLMSTPVLRFAPSPNGRLHLGHAYSALLNAELAAHMKGRFLVRLEDIDTERCTAALAEQCLADLAWLGLQWEQPVRVQSQHGEDYAKALAVFQNRGVVYPCFCTRSEIAQASQGSDPDGAPLYPHTCRGLSASEIQPCIAEGVPHCWRLNMEKALQAVPGSHSYKRFTRFSNELQHVVVRPERWGDVVIARKGIMTSYHLSVVVDDALQGITHVVRGADLEASTDLHVLLQVLLGLSSPLYHHHALLTLPTGDKLSKSKGSESLADLRARGITAQQVRRDLGFS